MIRWTTSLVLTIISCVSLAQERVEYTPDFQFQNGIYLSFQDFKDNRPIPITHILSNFDIRNPNYLKKVLEQDSIIYYDNFFEERKVAAEDIWGFAKLGRVHVGHNLVRTKRGKIKEVEFFPLHTIGSICYYSAQEYVYSTVMSGPGLGMYRDPFYNNDQVRREKVPVFILIDFENGEIILISQSILSPFVTDSVYSLFERDPSLLREFASLPLREQRKQAMFYIKRFNERNPVFFPVSN